MGFAPRNHLGLGRPEVVARTDGDFVTKPEDGLFRDAWGMDAQDASNVNKSSGKYWCNHYQ